MKRDKTITVRLSQEEIDLLKEINENISKAIRKMIQTIKRYKNEYND